ncbi:MAG TPA: substrate-binding domain-containing protein [Bacillota bacterium]|nr:substrate-binding domain-containing protein [Bacillota bacterium]
MVKMKKIFGGILLIALVLALFAGCNQTAKTDEFAATKDITVITREEGSGTRGAFIELMGVEQNNDKGIKVDYTTPEAISTNNTAVMLTTVAGNPYAIGYISLGSLNDTVKELDIDGVKASVANIKNSSYKVARPFLLVTKGDLDGLSQDFVAYILSAEGKVVIEKAGYIGNDDTKAYNGVKQSGKIVVAGSSSVTPVMEKLKEAYLVLQPSVTIEIQQSDSTTGITAAATETCQIGMASRDLKGSETAQGLTGTKLAMDGIAIIVNTTNPLTALKSTQVKDIFTGTSLVWKDVIAK